MKRLAGVRRRAHQPAAFATESLDGGSRVHISDGHDRIRGEPARHERVPAVFHLADLRHIRHGAAGIEVGQDDLLRVREVGASQDVGALGHEVDAAEDQVPRLGGGRDLRELVGVAGVVGEADDLVPLVVVPQQDGARAELRPGSRDAVVHGVIGQDEVILKRAGVASPAVVYDRQGRRNPLQWRSFFRKSSQSVFRLQSAQGGRGC